MDRLSAMQVFAEVAQTGSFTAAAERLELSRAMVTRHVAELESWLGARLLERSTRRVSLTHAGEQALRYCQQMLALAQDVQEEMARSDGPLRGQLRLTTSMSFGYAHLAAALAAFLAQHPLLKIHLEVGDRALNLLEARIDVAIRISAEPDPGLIARRLADCESVLVAAPAYAARRGLPEHPLALPSHEVLGYTHFGRSLWQLRQRTPPGAPEQAQQHELNLACRFTANEATVLRQAALAGAGIALQPRYLVSNDLAQGRLVQVLPGWEPPRMAVQALYLSRQHQAPAVRALLDFLVAWFATPPWEASLP